MNFCNYSHSKFFLNRIVNFFGILAYSFLVALILIPHTGHIEGQKDIDRQKDMYYFKHVCMNIGLLHHQKWEKNEKNLAQLEFKSICNTAWWNWAIIISNFTFACFYYNSDSYDHEWLVVKNSMSYLSIKDNRLLFSWTRHFLWHCHRVNTGVYKYYNQLHKP